MSKSSTIRKYGKQHRKPKYDRAFAELPQTPVRPAVDAKGVEEQKEDTLDELAGKIANVKLEDEKTEALAPVTPVTPVKRAVKSLDRRKRQPKTQADPVRNPTPKPEPEAQSNASPTDVAHEVPEIVIPKDDLRVLSWSEVCPPGDKIVKIAEASYAEVYRVSNERGTSIIKVIRMESPIKVQTKAQQKSGLVDEEPHCEADLMGELQISEWLADIPGFVVYKERYIVQGKACKELLETHQAFHKKVKRQDPDNLQFYPSPSRYLDDTKFLVVELGDAGIALEDFELVSADQLWDIFFHVTIALARAEAQVEFEHRDLHEGNLCIRQTGEPTPPDHRNTSSYFGHSGLEITILDYGLSRASANSEADKSLPIAYDLERDLSLFTSEHAPQCKVYRQMRSFLLRGDRVCLHPKRHKTPYEAGIDGPISWSIYEPYTNVLWLAYTYDFIVSNFRGPKKELNAFKKITKDFWTHLDPEADDTIPGFASASDIVMFAVDSGWIDADQLIDDGGRDGEAGKSILSILMNGDDDLVKGLSGLEISETSSLRRSPRRLKQRRDIV